MTHRLLHPSLALLLCVGLAASVSPAHASPQIWSGRTYAFSKAAFADPTAAVNQDRITSLVWITRASTQGLYNAAQEAGSSGPIGLSPLGTEWATGDALNYGSLAFTSWVSWAGGLPPATVGLDACVHLIAEDIYIDIRFDSWGAGLTGGGAFSYHRGVAGGATPAAQTTWGRLKELYR